MYYLDTYIYGAVAANRLRICYVRPYVHCVTFLFLFILLSNKNVKLKRFGTRVRHEIKEFGVAEHIEE